MNLCHSSKKAYSFNLEGIGFNFNRYIIFILHVSFLSFHYTVFDMNSLFLMILVLQFHFLDILE